MDPACYESLSRGVAIESCALGVSWVVEVSDGSGEAVSHSWEIMGELRAVWEVSSVSGAQPLY